MAEIGSDAEQRLDQLTARLEHAAAIVPSAWIASMLFRECAEALAERDRRIAELEADAERYRYLRDRPTFHQGVSILIAADAPSPVGDVSAEAEFIDAVIDAARAKGST